MDTKLIFSAIMLIILVSLQYTLNLILKGAEGDKKILMADPRRINLK